MKSTRIGNLKAKIKSLFRIASRLIEIPPAAKILLAKNRELFFIWRFLYMYQFLIS